MMEQICNKNVCCNRIDTTRVKIINQSQAMVYDPTKKKAYYD